MSPSMSQDCVDEPSGMYVAFPSLSQYTELVWRRLLRLRPPLSSLPQKVNLRYTEDFILQLERELVQARLKEAESQCAMKDLQDKVLEMEKRNTALPDESNVVQLQEELIGVKLREAEAVTSLKELRQQVRDLEEHWQKHLARTTGRWKDSPRKNTVSELQDELMSVRLREAEAQAELRESRQRMLELETQNQIQGNQLRRAEQEGRGLQERTQLLTAQNKGLLSQLQEIKRKQAEIECKNREEVMAVRLREADNIAAMAELQQQISELEIQKEEGKVHGQLNNSDSNQYIRDLKDQIAELKHEIRCLKGERRLTNQPTFDGIHIVNHYIGDDESYHSSDEDMGKNLLCGVPPAFEQRQDARRIVLHPNLADSDSDEDDESLRLSVPSTAGHAHNGHKTTSV
ncbi:hypothetical protein JZ751_019015 [Albula glossodonta]|uniref:Uncharacterized protein n=1 Tax=Albula glossodonta TaxID=121402 RepID=A0A8T2NQP1_9TELE|nr:hypothetical protein JZ751_019015 [Albula glossodonta]